jgi:hypothetical protein
MRNLINDVQVQVPPCRSYGWNHPFRRRIVGSFCVSPYPSVPSCNLQLPHYIAAIAAHSGLLCRLPSRLCRRLLVAGRTAGISTRATADSNPSLHRSTQILLCFDQRDVLDCIDNKGFRQYRGLGLGRARARARFRRPGGSSTSLKLERGTLITFRRRHVVLAVVNRRRQINAAFSNISAYNSIQGVRSTGRQVASALLLRVEHTRKSVGSAASLSTCVGVGPNPTVWR